MLLKYLLKINNCRQLFILTQFQEQHPFTAPSLSYDLWTSTMNPLHSIYKSHAAGLHPITLITCWLRAAVHQLQYNSDKLQKSCQFNDFIEKLKEGLSSRWATRTSVNQMWSCDLLLLLQTLLWVTHIPGSSHHEDAVSLSDLQAIQSLLGGGEWNKSAQLACTQPNVWFE